MKKLKRFWRRLTRSQRQKVIAIAVVLVVAGVAWGMISTGHSIQPLAEYFPFLNEVFPQESPESQETPETPSVPASAPVTEEGATVRVHILDVGQADCILVQGPDKTLVIDGGESENGPGIAEYLQGQGVEKIDYYLNTHPHADHMGGITQVMDAIPTGEFFHHPPPEKYLPTTRGYQKLMQYLIDNKIKTTVLDPGDTLDLGGGAVITYLAPLEEYDDMNNNSLVGRLVFGRRAFLFTGDAEKKSESAILKSGAELSADVYSAPHHGSNTSTSQAFLDAVGPEFATISVGEGNDYGHPSRETLEKLEAAGIPCLRTDLLGNIVITTDGESLDITTDRGRVVKTSGGNYDLK